MKHFEEAIKLLQQGNFLESTYKNGKETRRIVDKDGNKLCSVLHDFLYRRLSRMCEDVERDFYSVRMKLKLEFQYFNDFKINRKMNKNFTKW